MTRNGCWRECSSLSVAPVPVVYLSGTRIAPFHPGEKHGEAETAVSRLFFYVHVHVPLSASSPLVPFQLSPAPIFMPGKTPFRESRLITLFYVMPRAICTCMCDFLLGLYFCRSGYESSMTTGPRTIDATMDYLQTCLIFYLLILCFCGGRSIDICK